MKVTATDFVAASALTALIAYGIMEREYLYPNLFFSFSVLFYIRRRLREAKTDTNQHP